MKSYRTIVADPPWDYGRDAERWVPTDGNPEDRRAFPYRALDSEAIAALPVDQWSAKDARLFLWATNQHLPEALTIASGWGFAYRQTIVWHKLGAAPWGGSIAPNSAEFLLVCAKGNPSVVARWPASLVAAAKPSTHSQKPDVFLDIAEATSPGPYLEMFARRARFGWDYWGNESLGTAEMEVA